jgi:hypothetical protein
MTIADGIRRPRRLGALVAPLALLLLQTGCAFHTVRAYQREYLTSRIMTFEAGAREAARRTKALDAREGSTGGNGGAGGGCACN